MFGRPKSPTLPAYCRRNVPVVELYQTSPLTVVEGSPATGLIFRPAVVALWLWVCFMPAVNVLAWPVSTAVASISKVGFPPTPLLLVITNLPAVPVIVRADPVPEPVIAQRPGDSPLADIADRSLLNA